MKIFKNRIVIVIAIILVIFCGYYFYSKYFAQDEVITEITSKIIPEIFPQYSVIGNSVNSRKIEAFTYKNSIKNDDGITSENSAKHILFVGGIHGGYEWNSVLLAYEMMDYIEKNPSIIPENLIVTIIPSANPDGLFSALNKDGRFTLEEALSAEKINPTQNGLGRFNANNVDLNRNFDCKWKPESTWRGKVVSAGTSAFSEPEAVAIRDFVLKSNPVAVVFWHSQSNAVYASECLNGILPETLQIMNLYSGAAGYSAVDSFEHYEITGDAEGWLASINIPAITVELKTHATVEFDQNLAGVKSLLEYYSR